MRWKLPRLQLFEFCDQSWYQGILREAHMDTMDAVHTVGRPYHKMAKPFCSWAAALNSKEVLDLCSGGGRHIESLTASSRSSEVSLPNFVLSDLFPQIPLWKKLFKSATGRVDYIESPLSALEPSPQYKSKSIFSAFHHFPPETARQLIVAALSKSQGLFIAEPMSRSWANILIIILCSPAFFIAPFLSNRFSFRKLLLVLSLITPLTFLWDAIVSVLRMYTADEVVALIPEPLRSELIIEHGKHNSGLAVDVTWIAIRRKNKASKKTETTAKELREDWIKEIVALAGLAPTGDNCQPWSFRWTKDTLKISHDSSKAAHCLNQENHASLLSLGCVLESIAIAASSLGLMTESQFQNLKSSPTAEVRFAVSTTDPDELADCLAQRCTDRRKYKGGSIDKQLTDTLCNYSKGLNVSLYLSKVTPELTNFISSTELFIWEHKEAHQDIHRWLRLSRKAAMASRDGLPWYNLGIDYAGCLMLALTRQFSVQQAINYIFFKKFMQLTTRRLLRSSAGLGLITVHSKAPADLIDAGRLWLKAWCCLNKNGFGLHPITSSTIPSYDIILGTEMPSLLPDYRSLFLDGLNLLQKTFSLAEQEIPIVMFRTGLNPPLPQKLRTLRLPLDQVLRF